MKMPLLLIAFGSTGVLARYYIEQNLSHVPHSFPAATFTINILGSFLIGLLYVLVSEKSLIDAQIGAALSVGLLGGFTTFSAYSLQALQLFEQKKVGVALGYVVLSPVLGLLAAALAVTAARSLIK